jgi:hypothetical protein
VYAPVVQAKAERRAERSRTHRGTKKRGLGSKIRRSSVRGVVAALAWAGRASTDESNLVRKMEKADRARRRIDKLHDRGTEFGLLCCARMKEAHSTWETIRAKVLAQNERSRASKTALREARDRSWRRYINRRSQALKILSGVWGIPKDATFRNLEHNLDKLMSRALPRVTLREWSMCDTDVGAWARSRLMHQQTLIVIPFEAEPCRCRGCRTHVECPDGHGLSAGSRSCRFCGWLRATCIRPLGSRPSGNWRRKRDRPVRIICRRCGGSGHRADSGLC